MAAVISAAGCRCAENLFCADEAKITRFFSWAAPQNEIQAQKFAQAGVPISSSETENSMNLQKNME